MMAMPPGRLVRIGTALLMVACVIGFMAMAHVFVLKGHQHALDIHAARWVRDHRTPAWTEVMLFVTHLHAVKAAGIYTTAVALLRLARRQWTWLMALVLIVPGGMLVNVLLKHTFQRARPLADDALLSLSTYSFPSGHASAATLLYGAILLTVLVRRGKWPSRIGSVVLAVVAIVAVSFSRVYLGVHYFSDVAAGVLGAIAWLCLCIMVLPIKWYRRHSPA